MGGFQEAAPDGSWNARIVGPCYDTAINLTILQLEKGAVPIFQRPARSPGAR